MQQSFEEKEEKTISTSVKRKQQQGTFLARTLEKWWPMLLEVLLIICCFLMFYVQESMEMSDDVNLKKLLKEKKKRVNFVYEGDSEIAELEFERLSKVKSKVDSMKQKLNEVQNCRAKGSTNEPSIIYVPTAQLREKVE